MGNLQPQVSWYGQGICCNRAQEPKLAYRLTQSARSESEAEQPFGSQPGLAARARTELTASLLSHLSRKEKSLLSFSRPRTLIYEQRELSTNPPAELPLRRASRTALARLK